ncbi:hypothetical protein FIV00_02825 [Labrenzia sp. THAF82]|uniref:hypothetical protein n=1 Tax=Labrenzia sp. THAF82 TaxID=2587861 RepID=UPI0012683AAE|nr:hypothetical protein [Labrenzia sp. THAF82]QFT29410.1 hypothetical protein FIV00_02825 [Labrenzia sp. THAF82]
MRFYEIAASIKHTQIYTRAKRLFAAVFPQAGAVNTYTAVFEAFTDETTLNAVAGREVTAPSFGL